MKQRSLIILLIAFVISACGPGDAELTLVAEHESASTRIHYIRQTATVAQARVQTTYAYIQTRIGIMGDQREFLQATLVARGTDPGYIDNSLNNVPGVFPTFTPVPTAFDLVIPTASTPESSEPDTPATIAVTPPAADNPPSLINIVMAEGVGENDCALNSNPRFTSNSEQIYVVATAVNVPAQTVIASRWQRNGVEIASFNFTSESTINGECIWFFIDQTDAEFTPGSWSVVLELNGVAVGSPMPFTVEQG